MYFAVQAMAAELSTERGNISNSKAEKISAGANNKSSLRRKQQEE
jgi:hypothetical protein